VGKGYEVAVDSGGEKKGKMDQLPNSSGANIGGETWLNLDPGEILTAKRDRLPRFPSATPKEYRKGTGLTGSMSERGGEGDGVFDITHLTQEKKRGARWGIG